MGMIDNPNDPRQDIADFMRRIADLERTGPASVPGGGGPVGVVTFDTFIENRSSASSSKCQGFAIDASDPSTVTSAQVRVGSAEGTTHRLECWRAEGVTLMEQVGSAVTATSPGATPGDPAWVPFPPTSWALAAGSRYVFLLVSSGNAYVERHAAFLDSPPHVQSGVGTILPTFETSGGVPPAAGATLVTGALYHAYTLGVEVPDSTGGGGGGVSQAQVDEALAAYNAA